MHKKGISLNSVEKFLSHSADKIRRRTLLCFERILVSKIFKQRRGEASRFCRKFLPHSTETKSVVKEPFCFPESFGYRKVLCPRGEYRDFRWKIWCLTVTTNFVGKAFCVSQNFWYRKILRIRGGGGSITIFFKKFFCFTVPKNFVRERFSVPQISGIEKFYA